MSGLRSQISEACHGGAAAPKLQGFQDPSALDALKHVRDDTTDIRQHAVFPIDSGTSMMGNILITLRIGLRESRRHASKQYTTYSATTAWTRSRHYSESRPKRTGNRIYNPIRHEDEFENLNLLSASGRRPLITFWSTSWCTSCKAVRPLIRDLIEQGAGEEYGGVGFAEVELDSPTLGPLAMRYMINSMPTLLSFDRQEPQLETKITRLDDMKDRQFLRRWIESEARRNGRGGGGGSGKTLLGQLGKSFGS